MPEFRKWITALAGVALFAGLASAQVSTPGSPGGAFLCATNTSVTPTLRSEGYTELAGDIVISCTGGTPPALGSVIPTTNITVFLNTAVTSRLLANTNASEALLLVDEPGSQLPIVVGGSGTGPGAPQTVCSTPTAGAGPGGCTEFVGTSAGGLQGEPTTTAGGTSPGANVFQGIVSGSSVTFFGIPVLPPSTAGVSRIYRITNLRVNANQIPAGGTTPGAVSASISVNGSTSLPITNPNLTLGFVEPGLASSVRKPDNSGSTGGTNLNQCGSTNALSSSSGGAASAAIAIVRFQEAFATAFKVRTQGLQNVPGTIYNSESGLEPGNGVLITNQNSGTGVIYAAGLADFGTRLKATFTNVPSGVTIYVSTRDVTNDFTLPTSAALPNAQLVVSETSVDLNGPPLQSQTASFATTGGAGAITVPISPVSNIVNGTGSAVWEVTDLGGGINQNTIDTLDFGVYVSFTGNANTNTPAAPSSISVTLSFAPTPSGGGFTATNGQAASSTLPIPRFSDSLDKTFPFANFVLCTTNLLYPYVVNTNGFDTGLAIANTTQDPFGTVAQSGICTLSFFGSTAPTAAFPTPSIAAGTVYANLASTIAPGFSGYIVAVCNFQLAHGFAFVSDVGARNLAMGYLALVITSTSNGNRGGETGLNN